MQEAIESAFGTANQQLNDAIVHLESQLAKIRTGKASPSLVSSILIDYYGTPTPMNQVANVGTADAKTITIQPWEKSMLAPIEQAIFAANLGITPMNDGEFVRINIPPLTEERRKELVKQAKAEGEDAKVSLRHVRHKVMDVIKKSVKDGYPEDIGKKKEGEIDGMVKTFTGKIDNLIVAKEKDIMTI